MMHNNTVVVTGESLEITKNYPFRIALASDLQTGCQYGIAPTSYDDQDGNIHCLNLNKGQKQLLKDWDKFANECNENKVNYLWIPGDLIGGQNPIERGKYMMDVDLEAQKLMATQLIQNFVKKVPTIKEVWIWRGTPYHGSRDTSIESSVVDKLVSRGIPAKYRTEYSFIILKHNGKEKRLFITHPTPDASLYPEAGIGRNLRLYQEKIAQGKLPPIHMEIRAHKHEFIEVHKSTIRGLQLPCWQYFVPYDQAMKNFAAYQPDIGGVILMFDDKLRTQAWHFVYENYIEPERFLTVNGTGVTKARLSKK